MTLFFTSDTHFGDHRVLNIGKRPFASVAEMDEALIDGWNARVRPEDEVWHLGDFCRGDAGKLLARLNGIKHLVAGNNDPDATRAATGWTSVADYRETEVDGRLLVLCHYPFRSWRGMSKGAVNLHGHSHGRLKPVLRQFDVGVDARAFVPVMLSELLQAG